MLDSVIELVNNEYWTVPMESLFINFVLMWSEMTPMALLHWNLPSSQSGSLSLYAWTAIRMASRSLQENNWRSCAIAIPNSIKEVDVIIDGNPWAAVVGMPCTICFIQEKSKWKEAYCKEPYEAKLQRIHLKTWMGHVPWSSLPLFLGVLSLLFIEHLKKHLLSIKIN